MNEAGSPEIEGGGDPDSQAPPASLSGSSDLDGIGVSLELLHVAVYACAAPSGVITYHNEQAVRLWGRAPRTGDTDARFCGSLKLFLPDGTFLPHDVCPMAVALREGRSFRNQEVVILRPDGRRIHALVNIDPLRDASGRVVGAINAFLDVTPQKLAEQALRHEKDNLQALLDTLPVAVFFAHDPDCRDTSGNRAAAELLRRPGGDVSATPPSPFQMLRGGEPLAEDERPIRRAARGEVVRDEEIDYVLDDGSVRHALVSARPLCDADGRSRGAVASVLDITVLRTADTALKEADRRKDEFLATLSHELRNPLAPLLSGLHVLAASRSDALRFESARAIMQRQLAQLVRLVDDLLDVNRISQGKLTLQRQRIALSGALSQVLEVSLPLAEARQQRLEIALPETPVLLDADPERLTQVFCNLLDNAIKYTPDGGNIWLRAEPDGAAVRVSIRDSGAGIAAEQLERIFELFSQVASSGGPSTGLGIGLSLARRLVELHGGTLTARSEGLGLGSEFVLRLPTAAHPRATEELPRPPAECAIRARLGRRILVVDDNLDAAKTLAVLLEMAGHQTQIAHDGARALEQAESFRPSVILLDIGLPEMNGYEVCRTLRQRAWGADVTIVALTGWGQERDRRRSAEAGFDAHLVKPIAADPLLDFIDARTRHEPVLRSG